MEHPQLNWIANFIWGVADDVLRDLYVRGKYRDVILPMMVLRRLDALLEPSTLAVLEMKTSLDKAKIIHQDQALRQAAGQAFYNTSRSSRYAISRPVPANSNSRPTSRPISTASRRTSRTSWRSSSFGTSSPACPRPTPSAR